VNFSEVIREIFCH